MVLRYGSNEARVKREGTMRLTVRLVTLGAAAMVLVLALAPSTADAQDGGRGGDASAAGDGGDGGSVDASGNVGSAVATGRAGHGGRGGDARGGDGGRGGDGD
jgi:hypothetical protein